MWLFARRFSDKYGKKLIDTAAKTERDAGKTAFKKVVQKTVEATGISMEIKYLIKSVGKTKSRTQKMKRINNK